MAVNSVNIGTYGTWQIDVFKTGGDGVSYSTVRVLGTLINRGTVRSYNNTPRAVSVGGEQTWSGSSAFDVPGGGAQTIIDVTFTVYHSAAKYVAFSVTIGATGTTTFGSGGSVSVGITLPANISAPAAPSAVSISSVTGSSVYASFTDGANGGAEITNRRIGYGTDPSGPSNFVPGAASTITGLASDTVYYFWAQTQNQVNWSPYGPRSSQRTDTVPGIPTAPVASSITKDSAYITSSSNASNGGEDVDVRHLYISTVNNAAGASVITSAIPSTISPLAPKTTYYMWVRDHNSVGWSDFSVVGYFTTLAVPEPPTSVYAPPATVFQTSLSYSFVDGADNGAPISAREIAYSLTDGGAKTTLATGLNGVLSNLPPGTTLYLYARTYNSQGWSNYSPAAVVRTVAGAYVYDASGVAKEAVPYQKVSGVWELLEPYVRSSGIWRKTGR